jgi:hypothetical protein
MPLVYKALVLYSARLLRLVGALEQEVPQVVRLADLADLAEALLKVARAVLVILQLLLLHRVIMGVMVDRLLVAGVAVLLLQVVMVRVITAAMAEMEPHLLFLVLL